jgi:hypothetical protein
MGESVGAGFSNNSQQLRWTNVRAGGLRKPGSWMPCSVRTGLPICKLRMGLNCDDTSAAFKMGKPSSAFRTPTPGVMEMNHEIGVPYFETFQLSMDSRRFGMK